jgi:RNA polymerase sigma factor (sigma-70 family)
MSIVHAHNPGGGSEGGQNPLEHCSVIITCAQGGCRECLNTLLARHEGLVHYVVRNQIWGGVPEDDLLQEGRMALWRAIEGYDPERGAAFSTYASVAIARAVWQATERERCERRLERADTEHPSADPVDAYLELENGLWREQVHQVLAEACRYLSQQQQWVVGLVYGAGESGVPNPDYMLGNLAAAGRFLGISRERVRQVRNDALAVLRLPAFSVRLRQLCRQDSREAYLHSRQLSRRWLCQKGGA